MTPDADVTTDARVTLDKDVPTDAHVTPDADVTTDANMTPDDVSDGNDDGPLDTDPDEVPTNETTDATRTAETGPTPTDCQPDGAQPTGDHTRTPAVRRTLTDHEDQEEAVKHRWKMFLDDVPMSIRAKLNKQPVELFTVDGEDLAGPVIKLGWKWSRMSPTSCMVVLSRSPW